MGIVMNMVSKVAQYDTKKGFGWIDNVTKEYAHKRIFFHIHDWHGNVAPVAEMMVEFEFGPSRKPGMSDVAVNVRPVRAAAQILDAAKGNGSGQ
jgi:cold shock CspA family protein